MVRCDRVRSCWLRLGGAGHERGATRRFRGLVRRGRRRSVRGRTSRRHVSTFDHAASGGRAVGYAGAWSRRQWFGQRRRNRLRQDLRRDAWPRNDGPSPLFRHVFDQQRATELLDAGHVCAGTRRGGMKRRKRPRRGRRGRRPSGEGRPWNGSPGECGPWRAVVRRSTYLGSRPGRWPCSTGVGGIVVLVFGLHEGLPSGG